MAELGPVAVGDVVAVNRCFLETAKAVNAHQSAELRHSSVDTGEIAAVSAVIPILSSDADLFGEAVIICSNDAAFAGDQQLGRAQAVNLSVTLGSDRHTLVQRSKTVRRIKDEFQSVPPRDFRQLAYVSWITKVMDRNNRAGSWS